MEESISKLVASTLSIGATSALKSAATQATKDAYSALKNRIGRWGQQELNDVEALEAQPESEDRKATIAEIISKQDEIEIDSVHKLAKELIATISINKPVGVDISEIHSINISLSNIDVSEGIGVRAGNVTAEDSIEISDIRVGTQSEKQPR